MRKKWEQLWDKWDQMTWRWSCKVEDWLIDSDIAWAIFGALDEVFSWMMAHETLVYVISSLVGAALGIYVSITIL